MRDHIQPLRNKISHFGSLFLLLTFFATGCAQSPTVVKIGLVAPFEGEMREIGYDAIYAARLAVRQANESPSFQQNNFRVALVALDDGGHPESARKAAESLALDQAVVAVIGHGLPDSNLNVKVVYENHGIKWIPLGEGEYTPFPADELPQIYRDLYQLVTPFDEEAGPYAGPTADGMEVLINKISKIISSGDSVTRAKVLRE